ncbi:membrane fusion protein [Vibrio sp. JCM 19236]|nr:membrane fusion protein [Vibrio sp. JCM 19236]
MIKLNIQSIAVVASSILLFGCERPTVEPISHVPRVEVMMLGEPVVTDRLFFPAVAQAALRSHLSFRVAGEIVELPVNEGISLRRATLLPL